MLRADDFLITDNNYRSVCFDQTADGERFAMGLIPRNYSAVPVGSLEGSVTFGDAVDVPMIPLAEWPDRIAEKVAAKSQLSDIRNYANNGQPIPSLDQNGRGYCVTEDTEVLTEKGWIAYPDYDWKTPLGTVNPVTHALEYQVPFEKHVYEYDGEIIYSTNGKLDFGVTPDHQMYLRKWDERKRKLSDNYSFVRANDIGWYAGLLGAPTGHQGTEIVEVEVPVDRRYDGDDFFALLGVIVSDGFAADYGKSGKLVSFCCFRQDAIESVRGLAARCGFKEQPSRPGVFNRWGAGALFNWVKENCYDDHSKRALGKRIPLLVRCASQRQIKHFLSWFNDRSRDGNQFYTSSKKLADDIQEIHLKIGKRCSIRKRAGRTSDYAGNKSGKIIGSETYTVSVCDSSNLCIERKKHIERDRYKGLVYCAAVPNHTLITRRNGSVLVSSNCWAHSCTAAAILLRAVAGMPYVRLSAYAVACIIKNYRDQGGWGAQGLDFIRERGVPSVEHWPEKSVDRSNDNPATWENAALHKVSEGFIDLDEPQYDRRLTFQQVGTCLLSNIPVVGDFNWWGHSVCVMDLVDVDTSKPATDMRRYGVRIWNSWRDSWGTNGTGVLTGSKAIPDGATAPRSIALSDK